MTAVDRSKINFRRIRDEDSDFLALLYASTRAAEMNLVPWSDEQKQQFVEMQFRAQTLDYAEHYDMNQFFIIEHGGQPVGRLYLDRQPEDLCIIDITLLPELRGAGLGTVLLREMLDDAARSGITVSIHVEHFNPAMHLYERLGFKHVATNGVYHLMRWQAPK